MKAFAYEIPVNAETASRQRDALRDMLETAGWKVYCSMLQEAKNYELGRALEGRDQPLVFRSLGAADALGKMMEWPGKQVEALDSQLRAGDLPQKQT